MKNLFEKDEEGRRDLRWLLALGFISKEIFLIKEAIDKSETLKETITYIKDSIKPSMSRHKLIKRLNDKFDADGNTKKSKEAEKADKDMEDYVDVTNRNGLQIVTDVKVKIVKQYLEPMQRILTLVDKEVWDVVDKKDIQSKIKVIESILELFP